MLKKSVLFWIIGAIVGLYTAFVLQNLWSWFATEAFHVSPISFWVMYGLVLIIGMFSPEKFEETYHFKALAIGVDACIPDEKREVLHDKLREETEQVSWGVRWSIFGKLLSNTLTLAIGWAVHAFLTGRLVSNP